MLLVVFCLGIIGPMLSAPAQADEKDWSAVGDQMVAVFFILPVHSALPTSSIRD